MADYHTHYETKISQQIDMKLRYPLWNYASFKRSTFIGAFQPGRGRVATLEDSGGP